MEAQNKLIRFKKAEEDLDRLVEEKSQLELDEKHLAAALAPLSKEKEKLLQDHEDLKLKLDQEYDEQLEIKRSYQKEVDALLSLASRIRDYLDSKKGEKLKELQEKKSLFESQLQACMIRKQEISAELNKPKELLRNQDQLKGNIDDNLNYRRTKAEVDELACEIESLEDKILKMGGVSSYEVELKKHQQERERLLSEVPWNIISLSE